MSRRVPTDELKSVGKTKYVSCIVFTFFNNRNEYDDQSNISLLFKIMYKLYEWE